MDSTYLEIRRRDGLRSVSRARLGGFTLVEMLITVVVLAVLVAVRRAIAQRAHRLGHRSQQRRHRQLAAQFVHLGQVEAQHGLALPLQRQAREQGNSVFVDDNLRPFDDQWAFLSTVRSVSSADATSLIAKAAGCRIAILSNDLDLFYGRELRSRVAVLRHADFIIDATYTGVLKPDARAYALCLERLGLPAAACVFVDDQRRNVEGAIAAGMRAVQFDIARPAESFRRALDLLGVS